MAGISFKISYHLGISEIKLYFISDLQSAVFNFMLMTVHVLVNNVVLTIINICVA